MPIVTFAKQHSIQYAKYKIFNIGCFLSDQKWYILSLLLFYENVLMFLKILEFIEI